MCGSIEIFAGAQLFEGPERAVCLYFGTVAPGEFGKGARTEEIYNLIF